MTKKNLLKKLRVEEVSLVRRGANQRADVLIHKSHEEEDVGTSTATAPVDQMIAGFKKALEAMEIDDPQLRTASVEKALDEVRTSMTAVEKSDDDDKGGDLTTIEKALEERITKKFEEQIQKAEARQLAAESQVKKLLDDRREESIRKQASEMTGNLAVDTDKLVGILKSLSDEQAADLTTILTAANAANAPLFSATGKRGTVAKSADEQLVSIAKSLIAADPKLSYADAYAKAADQNPTLYEQTLGS